MSMEMKQWLKIPLLIEKTEDLVYDGRINGAAEGTVPIHVIEYEDGSKYQLSVRMTLISKQNER